MTHGDTKLLLECCTNVGQMDEILNKTYCKNDADKADYLCRLFEVDIVDRIGRSAHSDYMAVATTIIKHRVA